MARALKKINVAFVGCGRISDLHALGYQGNPRGRIYALCDTDVDLLLGKKKRWRVEKVYTNYHELLADSQVDAVEILTPQLLHESMVIDAVKAAKHIALQKPMTVSLASADKIARALSASDKVFKITENYLFYPPIMLAKELIAKGEIGAPQQIRIKFIAGSTGGWQVPAAAWQWRLQEMQEGRGMSTFDHGHHLWSTAWFLLGEVDRVTAYIDSIDGTIDCPATVIWKYKNQMTHGLCDFAFSNDMEVPSKYYSNDEWVEITGSAGIIFIHRITGNIHKGPALSLFKGKEHKKFEVNSDWKEGFIASTQNFLKAIAGEEPPLWNFNQGRNILKFALAIQKSAREQREVYLEELDSKWPWLYYLRHRRADKKQSIFVRDKQFSFKKDLEKYASQAEELTEAMIKKADLTGVRDWQCVIGLHLTSKYPEQEKKYGFYFKDANLKVSRGSLPVKATLSITMSAGAWAAILLKEKRVETLFLKRKIKAEGRVEEALKLRGIFKL